jgi:hypothetical protein
MEDLSIFGNLLTFILSILIIPYLIYLLWNNGIKFNKRAKILRIWDDENYIICVRNWDIGYMLSKDQLETFSRKYGIREDPDSKIRSKTSENKRNIASFTIYIIILTILYIFICWLFSYIIIVPLVLLVIYKTVEHFAEGNVKKRNVEDVNSYKQNLLK